MDKGRFHYISIAIFPHHRDRALTVIFGIGL